MNLIEMTNKLPTVEHKGTIYTIDLRLEEIRPNDKPYMPIRLDDIADGELFDKVINEAFK